VFLGIFCLSVKFVFVSIVCVCRYSLFVSILNVYGDKTDKLFVYLLPFFMFVV
jgi:hypothetical protein